MRAAFLAPFALYTTLRNRGAAPVGHGTRRPRTCGVSCSVAVHGLAHRIRMLVEVMRRRGISVRARVSAGELITRFR